MFNIDDFNVVVIDVNGHFVRIEELNRMIEFGAINIDRDRLEEYKAKTSIIRL